MQWPSVTDPQQVQLSRVSHAAPGQSSDACWFIPYEHLGLTRVQLMDSCRSAEEMVVLIFEKKKPRHRCGWNLSLWPLSVFDGDPRGVVNHQSRGSSFVVVVETDDGGVIRDAYVHNDTTALKTNKHVSPTNSPAAAWCIDQSHPPCPDSAACRCPGG